VGFLVPKQYLSVENAGARFNVTDVSTDKQKSNHSKRHWYVSRATVT
jgi:hypothetical protein